MGHALSAAEAAVLETLAVPRYLRFFGEMALEALSPGEGSLLAYLGCRTGYPDTMLPERIGGGRIVGVDPSPHAIEIARAKAHTIKEAQCDYYVGDAWPNALEAGVFTHVLAVHPTAPLPGEREGLLTEAARLLMTNGQLVMALPLRGSFQEIIDLLREYATKHDATELGRAIEAAAQHRPTLETLTEEVEALGFEDVDVEFLKMGVEFGSGREFFEDPAARLLVLPDIVASMPDQDLAAPLRYVRDAIDKYWAEATFELTISVGCVRATST